MIIIMSKRATNTSNRWTVINILTKQRLTKGTCRTRNVAAIFLLVEI